MSTQSLALLVDHAASPGVTEPQSKYSGEDISQRPAPTPLSPLHTAPSRIPPAAIVAADRSDGIRPATPKQLESLTLDEPPQAVFTAAETTHSVWNPYMNRFRFLACCLTSLCGGLNDSAPGALLPYIEKDYSIGYAVVSLIFVANALGFVSAAFFINTVTNKYGRSRALILAQVLLLAEYITIVTKPPFPVVVVAFFVNGLGAATNLAINQVFCANLRNGPMLSGIYQGCYGLGGTVGPLIATAIVSKGSHWSTFYFMTLGVAATATLVCGWAFWSYEKDTPQQYESSVRKDRISRLAKLRKIILNKPTLLGSLFIFAYQGSEVAISGWVISFLVSYRGGDIDKVGYVTAGFWAGITLGRFLLSHVGAIVGERPFVFAITAGALVLQLLVWFVPSIIGDSIAVALAGFLLGPIYPGATSTFVRLIPREMQVSSFSFIASIGSSGGAFVPFMIGILAQQAGTWVLHPICIGLFLTMECLWYFLPVAEKRSD